MKKTIIAVILVSLIICASGCADSGLKNSSQSNSSPTTSSIESSDFSDNSSDEKSEGTFEESEYSYSEISENSDYELSEDDVESEISEISEESEVLPVEYSEAVDEDDEDNESSLSASKLKDDLDNFFIDNSLGAEYRALVEAYGKDYVKKNIVYYDCIDDKSILEKDNWTIRKWTIENDKIMLGYEKTTYGIGSLKNMLDSIPSSDTYQTISKISDIVSTAKNLGIIDDD